MSRFFDLFPRTTAFVKMALLGQKHTLINSREQTQIRIHTRHQDETPIPFRVHRFVDKGDVKDALKPLISTYYSILE